MADYSVDNSGTLEDLHRQLDELVASGKLPLE
jgi:dephospho-CoA kinase